MNCFFLSMFIFFVNVNKLYKYTYMYPNNIKNKIQKRTLIVGNSFLQGLCLSTSFSQIILKRRFEKRG